MPAPTYWDNQSPFLLADLWCAQSARRSYWTKQAARTERHALRQVALLLGAVLPYKSYVLRK